MTQPVNGSVSAPAVEPALGTLLVQCVVDGAGSTEFQVAVHGVTRFGLTLATPELVDAFAREVAAHLAQAAAMGRRRRSGLILPGE